MRITIPVYITQRKVNGSTNVVVRPLFFPSPEKSGRELGRVIAALSDELRVRLTQLGKSDSHVALMRWHSSEAIEHRTTKLHLDLRDRTANLKLSLVSIQRFDRRLVFSPSLSDLWFDVMQGESLEQRATEVYESHFRQLVKDFPDYRVETKGIDAKAWIDEVTLEITPGAAPREYSDPLRAFLGGEDVSDGAGELQRTGRCLNRIDIEQLATPIGVRDDVRRLMRLMDSGDRRSVVLVGPSGSGKTARIEGVARKRRGQKRSATEGLIWQLSPSRLISGMSYLGQWQERVLAILHHAYRQDHILYFDDFLGLYEAGKTRDSVMCVADTLRAQLEVEPVRLLTEMTDEAWAILRERDRTLADQFVVMPTAAMDSRQSLEIMIGVRQRLEASGERQFEWSVLPEILSMYDRFDRGSVLPGKAVSAMHRLASRSTGQTIARSDALTEFQSRSGLQASIIDRNVSISRVAITKRIRTQVVGQDEPVERLVDRVMVAAARLNDTSRPIGTYLLVGPTGVGKTQLAKAVASCLFDDGGLIRLDMNELSSPASASRLVGTFDAPDGLLTSAVRRRPNAVLLLDEIEKAHPTVLDVLLQALGEARLSDARGRTVDLSGLLILMTSNLGSRTSGRSSGFRKADDSTKIKEDHLNAVKAFFRPEFFNRIDGVLSFERLSVDLMESIAHIQFREILQRDGLQRRNVLIDIDPDAIRQIAQRGYDPAMGARSLKRQIERDLIGPAARVLAETKTEQPMLLRLRRVGDQVKPDWQAIEYLSSDAANEPLSLAELDAKADDWMTAVESQINGSPLRFEVGENGVDPGTLETMTLRDSLLECQHTLRSLREILTQTKLQRPQASPIETASTPPYYRFAPPSRVAFRDMQAIDDIQDFLKDSLVVTQPSEIDPIRENLVNQLGRLNDQLAVRGTSQRYLVWTRWYGDAANGLQQNESDIDDDYDATGQIVLANAIERWVTKDESLTPTAAKLQNRSVKEYAGALAAASLQHLCGSWVFINHRGQMNLADVQMRPIDDGDVAEEFFRQWQSDTVGNTIAPVRRIVQSGRPLIDLKTGIAMDLGQHPQRMFGRMVAMTDAVVRLLKKSRQSTDFLDNAMELGS